MVCFFQDLWLQSHKIDLRFCIPMDNDRPSLDVKHFDEICPDKNGMSKCNDMNRD